MEIIFRLFNGRINRQTYFAGYIFYTILWIIVKAVFLNPYYLYLRSIKHADALAWAELLAFIFVILMLSASLFILHVALSSKRFHDLGESGWMALATFIPFVGLFYLISLIFKSGQSEANSYGKPPAAIINAFSIMGLQILKKKSDNSSTQTGNKPRPQTKEEILRKILDLTSYTGDKESFVRELITNAEKQTLTDLLPTLPLEKQADLREDLSRHMASEGIHDLLLFYFRKEAYEPMLHQIIDEKLSEYLQKITPSLSEREKEELQEYITSLP